MKWPLCIGLTLVSGAAAAYEFDPNLWQRLVVTEVMVAPLGDSAQAGQWIEVRNPKGEAFNLQGVVLATVRGGFHVVSPSNPLMAEPNELLLLAPYWEAATLPKGRVDYAYGSDFWLDSTEDIVFVLKAGKVLDLFAYGPDSIPVKPGASFSLEHSVTVGEKEWCYGREPFDPAGNLATPGQDNPDCDGDRDGFAEDQGDCDDHDPAVNAGASEVCNGIDDDCNGFSDDDPVPAGGSCQGLGVCAGAKPACAGVAGWRCPYPDTYEEVEASCDGLDNDCDGDTDEGLSAPGLCLGLGVCAGTGPACMGVTGWTCPYPDTFEADEVSCDGLDNDCDGDTDDGFDVGTPCSLGLGACARNGTRVCTPDRTGAKCDAQPGLPTVELCGDGRDNDCDGDTDEDFPVGTKCVVGTGTCRSVGKYRCAEDSLSVICGAIPGTPETERCGDGLDNDCDGATDEDDCEARMDRDGGCSSGPRGSGRADSPISWLVLLCAAFAVWCRARIGATRRHSGRSGIR